MRPNLPDQLPAPGEIAGQEQGQKQTDRLDRLNGTKVHLRAARAWAVAEDDQQGRQAQCRDQGHIAQFQEGGSLEVDEGDEPHQREACDDALRVSIEQQRVAQWIRSTQENCEAQRREEVGRSQQQRVAAAMTKTPYERQRMERGDEHDDINQDAPLKLLARSHNERRLEHR